MSWFTHPAESPLGKLAAKADLFDVDAPHDIRTLRAVRLPTVEPLETFGSTVSCKQSNTRGAKSHDHEACTGTIDPRRTNALAPVGGSSCSAGGSSRYRSPRAAQIVVNPSCAKRTLRDQDRVGLGARGEPLQQRAWHVAPPAADVEADDAVGERRALALAGRVRGNACDPLGAFTA